MDCTWSAFLVFRPLRTPYHYLSWFTHSRPFINCWEGLLCNVPPAHQDELIIHTHWKNGYRRNSLWEQYMVMCLSQGHIDMDQRNHGSSDWRTTLLCLWATVAPVWCCIWLLLKMGRECQDWYIGDTEEGKTWTPVVEWVWHLKSILKVSVCNLNQLEMWMFDVHRIRQHYVASLSRLDDAICCHTSRCVSTGFVSGNISCLAMFTYSTFITRLVHFC